MHRHRVLLGPPLTRTQDWWKLRAVAWLLNTGHTSGTIEFVIASAVKDSPPVAVFRQANKAAAAAAVAEVEAEAEAATAAEGRVGGRRKRSE